MIKNECGHAYKLLDHAECLWCENCVEKLAERLNKKPRVTEEFIEEWAEIIGDDSPDATKDFPEIEDLLKQMLTEIGIEISAGK